MMTSRRSKVAAYLFIVVQEESSKDVKQAMIFGLYEIRNLSLV